MLRNYFKIALRNIRKNKLFSAINIAGMTIGMASFIIISVFVLDELKYDQYHPDKERTFRVYDVRNSEDGTTNYLPIVPPVFAPTLKNDYPQIESTLRIMDTYGEVLLDVDGNKFFERQALYAEPTIFDILSIELVQGKEGETLSGPDQVAISEKMAEAHFKDGQALGKTILIDKDEFTIAGVYKNIPMHSHLRPEVIMSLNTLFKYWNSERLNNWVWQQFFTYVKFKAPGQGEALEKQLPAFSEKYAYPFTKPVGFTYTPHLQRIDDIYLHSSNFEWEIAKRGNIYTVYALAAAALFILLIVCVNFVNLSTAKSLNRLKEVGVRKVAGARKLDLIKQFLGESIVLSLISVILAGFLAELSIPYLNQLTGKNISASLFSEPYTPALVIGFALLLGVLAGAYPAFFASSFSSLGVFSKRSGKTPSNNLFRKISVVIQFALSIFLITGAIIVSRQLNYLSNKNLGFDKQQIVILPLKDNFENKLESIKASWKQNSSIKAITYSYGLPGQIVSGDEILNEENKSFPANHIMVDYDYIKTLGLTLVAGRTFSKDHRTDASSAFIINETAVRNLGYKDAEAAIGQRLKWDMWHYKDSLKRGEIIGVVKDFHFKSLRDELTTTILQIYPEAYSTIAVKIQPGKTAEALSFLKDQWKQIEPEWPFKYEFLDESFTKMYSSEKELSEMLAFFTSLGIFIACLGLFGLVYYITNQRLKEIGIRKVLGAPVLQIAFLINKNFLGLLIIGFVVATPLGYLLATNWLNNFAYKITLSPVIFLFAGGIMIVFSLLTVSYQSIKAALTNPVDTLKEE